MQSTSDSFTRVSLLQLALEDSDSPAWEELLRYYEPFVRRSLFHLGVKNPEVDDVCQQVLTRLWQQLKNYRRDEKRARFRTWLTKLIRNVAINDFRKRQRAKRTQGTDAEIMQSLAADSSQLEQKIEAEWQQHVIGLAMARIENIFTGKAIEVFLRVQEGESIEEVSESLGINRQSARVLKSRVKKRLMFEVIKIRNSLEFSDSNP